MFLIVLAVPVMATTEPTYVCVDNETSRETINLTVTTSTGLSPMTVTNDIDCPQGCDAASGICTTSIYVGYYICLDSQTSYKREVINVDGLPQTVETKENCEYGCREQTGRCLDKIVSEPVLSALFFMMVAISMLYIFLEAFGFIPNNKIKTMVG